MCGGLHEALPADVTALLVLILRGATAAITRCPIAAVRQATAVVQDERQRSDRLLEVVKAFDILRRALDGRS